MGGPEGSHWQAASAVVSNDVWATGYSEAGTLAEHWDGSSWSVVQTASGGSLDQVFLPGVVALSSNNVWSVGEALQSGHLSHTFTEQWNGASWVMVQSQNLGADHNELFWGECDTGRNSLGCWNSLSLPAAANADRAKTAVSRPPTPDTQTNSRTPWCFATAAVCDIATVAAGQTWPCSLFAISTRKSTIPNVIVPVVQRIEQGFPKP